MVKASILANRHSEPWSRSNLTRTYLHTNFKLKAKAQAQSQVTYSIKKRVRQSSVRIFQISFKTRNIQQTMPPTFLFLLYKIIKEQTVSKPSKTLSASTPLNNLKLQNPKAPTLNLVSLRRCGAGYLLHSVNRVNPFFSRNSQPYQPFLSQHINRTLVQSMQPKQQLLTSMSIAFAELQGRSYLPLAASPPSLNAI